MKPIALTMFLIGLSCGAWIEPGQAQDIRLNLVHQDAYMQRRIQVFRKSGEKMSNAVTIESFSPGSNSFTMRDVTGGKINVAVPDLDRIEFEQALIKIPVQAQTAAVEVSTQPGVALRYRVPAQAVRFDGGDLIFPASTPSDKITLTTPAIKAEHEGGHVETRKIVEARRLAWDAANNSFLIDVQEVTYLIATSGSGGPSGMVK